MASTGTKDSTSNQPANFSEETKKVVKAMYLFYEALDPVSKPTEQVLEIIRQATDLIDRAGNLNGRICKEMRRVNQDSYRIHKLNVDLYRKYLVEKRAHMWTKKTLQQVVACGYELLHFIEDEHDGEETIEDGQDGSDED
ncbi:hypothetical protein N8T08_002359 [Aspergillus melleus]|uniref:Uncharacterized protein n=1 Tax=Aspergillus melleus TaxID=138277 RepID=A0ACC3B8U8_9EURO|nr:hypothetical protein N8T08_002359 [Aspergillus melleus]